MKTQVFQIAKLRGMDQRWKPSPATASLIRDMTWDQRDGWKDSGGYHPLVTAPFVEYSQPAYFGESEITSLHWFAQHNGGRQWLIYETADGELKYFKGASAPASPEAYVPRFNASTYTARTYLNGSWQRTQSQSFGGRLYMVNGFDEPIVFDGRVAHRAGFDSPPSAPSVSLIDRQTTVRELGLGPASPDIHRDDLPELDEDGTVDPSYSDRTPAAYRYKVTFLNERGQESPPSASSSLIRFDNICRESGLKYRHFLAVHVPRGDRSVVARRIYRTLNLADSNGDLIEAQDGENYYFLAEIQDNITTYYEDGLQDYGLGSLMDPNDFGFWPAGSKYLAVFKNTMFVAGMANNEVRFSAPNQPEVFPVDNVFQVGDSDMGAITGIYPTKNSLVIFKPRGIYLIKGDPLNGFYAQTLTRDVGCSAPNTIKEVPGVGLMFLSDAGVYVLAGALENTGTATKIVNLSASIPDQIKEINKSAMMNACGVVYHQDKEYWLSVPSSGGVKNHLVLIYHYEIGAWSVRENFPISCMVETKDHRGYLIFGSHDTTNNPGLHVYTRGITTKGRGDTGAIGSTKPISSLYRTSHFDFGAVYRAVQPAYAMIYAVGYGKNDINLNFTVNRQDSTSLTDAIGLDQVYPLDALSHYDTATWDGPYTWNTHRPVVIRFDISAMHEQPVHELQLDISAASQRIQIIGIDLEIKVGEQRNMLPMTTVLGSERR